MRRILLLAAVSLLLLPATLRAEEESAPWYLEILRPPEAMAKINAAMKDVDRRRQRFVRQEMATEYLDAWKASGLEPEDDELDTLYSLNLSALRYAEALALVLPRVQDGDLAPNLRAAAAGRVGSILRNYRMAEALDEAVEQQAVNALRALLPAIEDEEHASTRGTIHQALAAHAGRQDDDEGQIEHLMLAAEATPASAGGAARTITRLLMGGSHDMAGYEAAREEGTKLFGRLKELAAEHLKAVRTDGDERAIRIAESTVERLATADRPLTMLGRPANPWTLEHAFGDVEALDDLKGKVVVLDFWATWCPWCIKSFPAIRDLLRDYADKDLAVVGVTASASAVYEHRYDLDDDLKDRMEPGSRPQAVARLKREGQRPGTVPEPLEEAEYRAAEKEALEKFIANHEMTWPVVMIDKEEPGPKYALMGWPHAVVLDREGRVRYFKSGALLRDRPEAVAAFRKVLDDLLAEGGQGE